MPLRQKLFITFVFLSGIILTLGVSARYVFNASETAMDKVLHNSNLLSLLNAANSNLAAAGNIPFELEQRLEGIDDLEARADTLKTEYKSLSEQIRALVIDENEKEHTELFIRSGDRFYDTLDDFFPLKLTMMSHYSLYLGEMHSLPDILLKREFFHVKFLQKLNRNVNKNIRITEGLDFRECGFYQWTESNTFEDETVNEVLQEMTPLHKTLHDTAAEIDIYIAIGDQESAREALTTISENLNQLTRLFSGLTNYSQRSFKKARDDYRAQLKKIHVLHVKSTDSATSLTSFLEESILQFAKRNLDRTTKKGKQTIYLASGVGIFLALLIGYYASLKVEGAMRDKESANKALEVSLEQQTVTNQKLEQEIVKRKEIEEDLQNANEILAKVAVTDGLTGLFNHRHMKKNLEYEWQRAMRFEQDLAVLMLDIDFFKKVNDTHGHGCGDTILKEMAGLFQKRIRYTDTLGLSYDKKETMVARYGGEEMVAILPNTSIFGATAVAEELRKAVENHVFVCSEKEIRITISVGVAVNCAQGDSQWQDILERADAALYQAKESGRNRVIGDVGSDAGVLEG